MAIAQFSGLASGIDSASLIDAIVEARELSNQVRRDEIESLESENSALDEFNTKLLALDELIDKFRTTNTGGVSKKATSSTPAVATATAGSEAVNASYSITVNSLANTATGSFDNAYATSDAIVSAADSDDITLTVGTGANQVVITAAVTAGVTTLQDVVDTINADPNSDGRVRASVVNIGTTDSPDHRLFFSTLEEGTAQGTLALSGGTIAELATTNIDNATNASFNLDGVSGAITRESNTISDVLTGVSFQLLDTGTTSVTVGTDADSTADQMQEIVDAYNGLVEFINENDTVERVGSGDDSANVFGSLAKTRVDDDFLSTFRANLSSATAENGNEVTSLAGLGISTNRDGTISFDSDTFKEQVALDPDGATAVLNDFADSSSGVSGSIFQYTQLNGFIDLAQSANNSEIENNNDSIEQLERRTAKLREGLTRTFARLESLTANLQSQGNALTGLLASL